MRLEGIQRRVRLEKLVKTTYLERRLRGNLIENFKIINGILITVDLFFNDSLGYLLL